MDAKVVVAGCTAHSGGFRNLDEQLESIRFVKYAVDDYNRKSGTSKIVIAGDGLPSTYNTLEFAKRVEGETGVFNHLMISPSTNKPSQAGLLEHYTRIAMGINSTHGRIIMYSVPGRTGGEGILPETAQELSLFPTIVGIKEASGKIDRIKETIYRTKDRDFVVLSGDDNLNIDIIEYGGTGTVSVAANVAPYKTSSSVRHALEGNFEQARVIDSELRNLYRTLFLNPSGSPSMAHYALRRVGLPVGVPRLPLGDATRENAIEMNGVLLELGLMGSLMD